MRARIYSLLFFLLSVAPVFGANKFLRKGATGANNGSDWTNAWNEFNQVAQNTLNADDIVYVAGGTAYTTSLQVGAGGSANAAAYSKSGTSGHPIKFIAAQSSISACTSAAGWNSAYDSQVVSPGLVWGSGETDGRGSYFEFYGGSNGWKTGITMDTGNAGCVFDHLTCFGSAPDGNPYTYATDEAAVYVVNYSGRGFITNPRWSYCTIGRSVNGIKILIGTSGFTVEYCHFQDINVANPQEFHGNVIFSNNTSGAVIIRYNYFTNWDSLALEIKGGGQNWTIYGNLFHDSVGGATGGVGRCVEVEDAGSTVLLYNNTMAHCWRGLYAVQSGSFLSGSQSRNNIFWDLGTNDDEAIADSDYNFTDKGSITGAHSIANGTMPFVNVNTNFGLLPNIGATYPRGKGVTLGSPFNASPYTVDLAGTTLAIPPDMGGIAYSAGGSDTTAPTPNPATIASTSHTASSVSVTASDATDETALGTSPYRFSNDNGSTWTAFQTSKSYTWNGLTASTDYPVKVQVQDAAGNLTTASSATTVTTDAVLPASPPVARIRRGAFN